MSWASFGCAGFGAAIYYLAPSGRVDYQTDSYSCSPDVESQSNSGVLDRFCDKAFSKASANFSRMDSKDFKEKFSLGVKKLIEMDKSSRSTAQIYEK